ncbi:hypothetical protein B9Z55_000743 [Caenorhabditis nigoni]|uniref:Uncharacterized protein n=1 Tax=Caenorhabditis nigoni TaxID=1611254 RepID=A0A2G5VUK9_9PELO|nr:hypothetical protein B9Z55_000743 [Caenorhabditis nigoni]
MCRKRFIKQQRKIAKIVSEWHVATYSEILCGRPCNILYSLSVDTFLISLLGAEFTPFLHIPVQSASDAVLTDMKREYSRRHFEQIADYMIEK